MKSSRIMVAAAQMKFRTRIADNLDWICATIATCARRGVDVLLFPECALTGYNCDFSALNQSEVEMALATIKRSVRTARCHVLLGCPTWRGRRRLNSLLVFNRHGREIFRYSKIHLTSLDRRFFTPGDVVGYFKIDGVPCTSIICHERRYPELVRLPIMLGAQIIFHPNAGLDTNEVSKMKRNGRDGIAVRAFENDVFYVFANSVGPQGGGLWSAGDSKIVGPNSRTLALANNRDEMVVEAELDLSLARRRYAKEALRYPAFLRKQWDEMLQLCRRQLKAGKSL